MDILRLLKEQGSQLLDEELDALSEELETGDYGDAGYLFQCMRLIGDEKVRRRNEKAASPGSAEASAGNGKKPAKKGGGVFVPTSELSPYSKVEIAEKDPVEVVRSDVAVMRRLNTRKSEFKKYIKNQPLFDEKLLDSCFSFFDDWEKGAILDVMKLSEPFLDKYFDSLDATRIAQKQLFSEDFFMRHYGELPVDIVLKKGKNPWRSKDKRSKKLDTFLRLKGVQF